MKLEACFALFDADGDGKLTRREMWCFLRSFITGLMALSSTTMKATISAVHDRIDDAAVAVTREVFTRLQGPGKLKTIPFTDFAAWYNQEGFKVIAWVELLDVNKWPASTLQGSTVNQVDESQHAAKPPTAPPGMAKGIATQDPLGVPAPPLLPGYDANGSAPLPSLMRASSYNGDLDEMELVGSFPLLGDQEDAPMELSYLMVHARDVHNYRTLLQLSKLHKLSAKALGKVLLAVEDEGAISFKAFSAAMRKTVDVTALSARERKRVSMGLQSLFFSFDWEQTETVDTAEFTAGLLLLARGSKSNKLSLAWQLFDERGSGYLDRRGLFRFVRSLLNMLVAICSSGLTAVSNEAIREMVDSAALRLAGDVFAPLSEGGADRTEEDFVSYEEFGQWYNGGGCSSAEWLELLDHGKWPPLFSNEDGFVPGLGLRSGGREVADSDEGDDSDFGEDSGDDSSMREADEAFEGRGGVTTVEAVYQSRTGVDGGRGDTSEQLLQQEDIETAEAAADGLFAEVYYGPGSPEPNSRGRLAPVFQFTVVPPNEMFNLSEADVRGFQAARRGSGLQGSPDGLHHLMQLMSMPVSTFSVPSAEALGMVDESAFKAFLATLPAPTDASSNDVLAWRAATRVIFNVMARSDTAVTLPQGVQSAKLAAAEDLVVGLSMFADGSKSSKLHFAFSAYALAATRQSGQDVDPSLPLTRLQLWRFVFALLGSLQALSTSSFDEGLLSMQSLARRGAVDVVQEVFGQDEDVQSVVTYNEFGDWYNDGGYTLAPWLELLHPAKWVQEGQAPAQEEAPPTAAHRASDAIVAVQQVDVEVPPGMDSGDRAVAAFDFPLLPSPAVDAVVATHPAIASVVRTSFVDSYLPLEELASIGVSLPHPDASGHLYLTEGDCLRLQRLLSLAQLDSWDPMQIIAVVLDAGSRGVMTLSDYRAVMRQMLPVEEASKEDTLFLSRALSRIFMCFDRFGHKKAACSEIAVGLSLFTSGSKSDKLTAAWHVFSAGTDGYMNRVQLWRFLRAFLTVLVAVKYLGTKLQAVHTVALAEEVDVAAVELSDRIIDFSRSTGAAVSLQNTDESPQDDEEAYVSYDTFGAWYNNGGFHVAPWLEILDLGKWPILTDSAISSPTERAARFAAEQPAEGSSELVAADESLSDDMADAAFGPPVFSIQLPGRTVDDVDDGPEPVSQLVVREHDVESLAQVIHASQLPAMSCGQIARHLLQEAKQGAVSTAGFAAVVHRMALSPALDEEDRLAVAMALNTLFFALDQDMSSEVDTSHLAIGLSLLAGGSKSDKLSFAWALLDDDEDGLLTDVQVYVFTRCFLASIMAFVQQLSNAAPGVTQATISNACAAVVADLFQSDQVKQVQRGDDSMYRTDGGVAPAVEFDAFAQWYNDNGWQVAPWLELLDLHKWGSTVSEAVQQVHEGASSSEEEDASSQSTGTPSADGEEEDDFQALVVSPGQVQFVLAPPDSRPEGGASLLLHQWAVTFFVQVASITGMQGRPVSDIAAAISAKRVADTNSLTVAGFDSAVRQLIPGSRLGKDTQVALSSALYFLFTAFAEDEKKTMANASDVIAALSLLAEGSKSVKLTQLWRVHAAASGDADVPSDDEDVRLTVPSLVRLLRSIVFALQCFVALGDAAHSGEALPSDMLQASADAAAEFAVARVVAEADTAVDGSVSFPEFGEWYNGGGSTVIPWLELLDVNKWSAWLQEALDGGDAQEQEQEDAGEEEEEEAVFNFPLATQSSELDDDTQYVRFTQADLSTLSKVVRGTNLRGADPELLLVLLDELCNGTSVTSEQFDDVISRLLQGQGSDYAHESMVRGVLQNMFDALDMEAQDSISFSSAAIGLSLLAEGGKTEKLSIAFRLVADDEGHDSSDQASFDGLQALLSSFLLSLAALQQQGCADASESLSTILQVAQSIALEAFAHLQLEPDSDTITFEAFGEWYNSGGYDVAPWLELLDLRKWGNSLPAEDAGEEEEQPLLRYEIAGDANALVFSQSDVDNFGTFLVRSALPRATPESVARLVAAADRHDTGLLDNEALADLTGHILERAGLEDAATPGAAQQEDPSDVAAAQLVRSVVFSLVDGLRTGSVSQDDAGGSGIETAEMITALSVYARGSKSDKLSSTFTLFDSDGDGALFESELWRFLLAIAVALHAGKGRPEDWTPLVERLVEVSIAIVQAAGSENAEGDASVSYEEFAQWYTTDGWQSLGWLELTDLRKWPFTGDTASELGAMLGLSSPIGRDLESGFGGQLITPGTEDAEQLGVPANVVFQFDLSGNDTAPEDAANSVLRLSFEDCANVQRLLRVSGLDGLEVRQLYATLVALAKQYTDLEDPNGAWALPKNLFNALIKNIIPGERLSDDEKTFLSWHFNHLFKAFDPSESGSVDFTEFAVGFSMLVGGRKSDKLSAAWGLFVRDTHPQGVLACDPDQLDLDSAVELPLERLHLWRFLRSFVTALASLSKSASGMDAVERNDMINSYSFDLSEAVLAHVGASEDAADDVAVSFEAFGEWYNGGGFSVAPWLELLDLRKWPDVLSDGLEASSASSSDGEYAPEESGQEEEDDSASEGAAGDHDEEVDVEEPLSNLDDSEEEEDEDYVSGQQEEGEAESGGEEEDDDSGDGIDDVHDEMDGYERVEAAGSSASGAAPVFLWPVVAPSVEPGQEQELQVRVMPEDCAAVHSLAAVTSLGSMRPSEVVALLQDLAGEDGRVQQEAFDSLVQDMTSTCPSVGAVDAVSSQLHRLYRALADSSEDPTLRDVMTALLVFSSGSKSSTLQASFGLAAGTSKVADATVTVQQLCDFLSALLVGILAVNTTLRPVLTPAGVRGVAQTTARRIAAGVRESAGSNSISLESLSRWYNDGGYDLAPWLELLDLRKWPRSNE